MHKREASTGPISRNRKRAVKILKQLHTDLQGPFDKSINRYFYALAIVNNHS
jgi:hypothetical protein